MTVIKVKNSNVAGRLPNSGDLVPAELALNLQDKKLYSKDTAGEIFEIGVAGDVPSGTNPPPSGNNVGDLFFDTDTNQLLYWSGTAWEVVTSEPADGSYVETAGDNMTGNLTLGTDKITLDAEAGSASFVGNIEAGNVDGSSNDTTGVIAFKEGTITAQRKSTEAASTLFAGKLGSATTCAIRADGQFNAGDWPSVGCNVNPTGIISIRRDSSPTVNVFQIYNGGTDASNRKVELKSDGSAEFAGGLIELNADGSAGFSAGSIYPNLVRFIQSTGNVGDQPTVQVQTNGTSDAPAFEVKDVVGSKGTTAAIYGNGSATFANSITSGKLYISGSPGTFISPDGGIVVRNDTVDDAGTAFMCLKGGNNANTDSVIRLNYGGSAEFAGGVTTKITNTYAYALENAGGTNLGGLYANADESTSLYLKNSTPSHSATITLNGGDGSGVFTGDVTAGDYGTNTSGSRLFGTYGLYLEAPSNAAGGILKISSTSGGVTTDTTTINVDGTATFVGDITAPNLTLRLAPDNDAHYTSTIETYTETETYEVEVPVLQTGVGTADIKDKETKTITRTREVEKEREVKTYTGPTLDVKETLLELTSALESLKAAASSAKTCDELRSAIENALGNIKPVPMTSKAKKK